MLAKPPPSIKSVLVNLKLSPTKTTNDEELDTDLAPILEYLNTNFEILTDIMEESQSFAVIKGVWDRIVLDFESFLVPNLYSDAIDKPLDDKQLSTLQYCYSVSITMVDQIVTSFLFPWRRIWPQLL